MARRVIVGMEGRFGNNAAAKSRFMHYEYLEITSRDNDNEDIWIYPLSIKGADLAEFLIKLHAKRPDIFPEEVQALRKDGLID